MVLVVASNAWWENDFRESKSYALIWDIHGMAWDSTPSIFQLRLGFASSLLGSQFAPQHPYWYLLVGSPGKLWDFSCGKFQQAERIAALPDMASGVRRARTGNDEWCNPNLRVRGKK
jgi:hypothetical protein